MDPYEEEEDYGPPPKPWELYRSPGKPPNPVPTTDKRVWKDVDALAADLNDLGFNATKKGKSLVVDFDFVYWRPPGDDRFGAKWARIRGTADVVDGAARVKLNLNVYSDNGWTAGRPQPDISMNRDFPLETILATNKASLLHQIVSALKKSGAPKTVAQRFKELSDARPLGMKLRGRDPKDPLPYRPQGGDQAAAARKGTLTLGKSLGTKRLPENMVTRADPLIDMEAGDRIEVIVADRVIKELIIIEPGQDFVVAADWGGEVYNLDVAELDHLSAEEDLSISCDGYTCYIDLSMGFDQRGQPEHFLDSMRDRSITDDQKARIRAELDRM